MRHAHCPAGGKRHDYRWEELQDIEKKRRALLVLAEDPWWKILTRWRGTVCYMLAFDLLFWLTIAIYACVKVAARLNPLPDFVADLASVNIAVVGGFLSFFLVFCVNQSHKRFFGLYHQSTSCKGRILDTATLAVISLPYAQASRLVRYMNAAHAAGYVGLSKVYPSQSYFDHIDKDLGLLTEEERARLEEIDMDKGSAATRELIAWGVNEIQTAKVSVTRSGNGRIYFCKMEPKLTPTPSLAEKWHFGHGTGQRAQKSSIAVERKHRAVVQCQRPSHSFLLSSLYLSVDGIVFTNICCRNCCHCGDWERATLDHGCHWWSRCCPASCLCYWVTDLGAETERPVRRRLDRLVRNALRRLDMDDVE